jgi:hypothetical protein
MTEHDFEGQIPNFNSSDKILIFSGSKNWWNLKFSLETTMRLKESNLNIEFFIIDSKIDKYFEVNKSDVWKKWRFTNPNTKIKRILRNLGIKTHYFKVSKLPVVKIPDMDNLILEDLSISGYNIGKIIKASVSGITKIFDFNPIDHSYLIKKHIIACHVYIPIIEEVLKSNPKNIFISNDRLFTNALCALIARKLEIDVVVSYWGSSAEKIIYHKNSLFDFKQWHSLTELFSSDFPLSNGEQKRLIQDSNFSTFIEPIFERSSVFQKNFKSGLVSKPGLKKRFVFFSGSSWEFSGLEELEHDMFANQYEALEFILGHFNSEEWEIILRHHPIPHINPEKFESHLWNRCRNNFNLNEIEPNSEVNSYELLMSADLVGVYNSTIGLESLSMGKSTIVLGNPYWINPNWGIWANTKSKATKILYEPVNSISRKELIKPLRFMKFFGSKFRYIEHNGTNIKLLGKYIFTDKTLIRFALKLLKKILVIWRNLRKFDY